MIGNKHAAGILPCFIMLMLCACSPSSQSSSVELDLYGYNYTDHYIDSFTVNGQSGGNLFVSSPTSGGGGSVCCVTWWPESKMPVKIRVRWVADYCIERDKNPYYEQMGGTEYFERRRNIWKEQDAYITQAVKDKPSVLEVHFYKDGRIEAAVTHGFSPPRVILPSNEQHMRPGVSEDYPRCEDAKK